MSFTCFFDSYPYFYALFFFSKMKEWDRFSSSSFECGFSSYFFSRFSFSVHYFLVSLLFLFLDLELCFIMPILSNFISSMEMFINLFIFVSILLIGLVLEWTEGKLNWIY